MIKQFTISIILLLVTSLLPLSVSAAEESEIQVRNDIRDTVKKAYMHNDFDKLEEMARTFRETGERTPSGLWKLSVFYYGISRAFDIEIHDDEYWALILGKADKWAKAYPDSPSPTIVKAWVLFNWGRVIRTQLMDENTDLPMEYYGRYQDKLIQAAELLMKTRERSSQDPHWYTVRALLLGYARGVDFREFNNKIDKGHEKFPGYYETYFKTVDFLHRNDYGFQVIEKWVNQVVEQTRETDGTGMYARLYWYIGNRTVDHPALLFRETNADWEKMKQGIADVIAKYPDNYNIQHFAFFACVAGDKEETRRLIEMSDETPLLRAWKSIDNYLRCRIFSELDGAAPSV